MEDDLSEIEVAVLERRLIEVDPTLGELCAMEVDQPVSELTFAYAHAVAKWAPWKPTCLESLIGRN